MTHSAHLILTVDYEIFGNGSGEVECCVLEPARKMMNIAEQFNAPVTFFVEVLEFIALEQEPETRAGGEQIRLQLLDAIERQHDAQLHLHPQWQDAEFRKTDGWKLDMFRWRIGDLNSNEIDSLFRLGKQWLEELVHSVNKDYNCHTFRAGGWCIQPSEKVLQAMMANDFKIDSTVAPGIRNSTPGQWSDFRTTPDKPFWRAEKNVCKSSETGTWELPILTGKIGRLRHFQAIKAVRSQLNGGMASGCYGSYQRPDGQLQAVKDKLQKLLRLGQVMLDFSTMPADILIEISQQWLEKNQHFNLPIPLVAIAHTKNFTSASEQSLQAYLRWAESKNIQFSTYGNWLEASSLQGRD